MIIYLPGAALSTPEIHIESIHIESVQCTYNLLKKRYFFKKCSKNNIRNLAI
jgi:hypothetical protein